MPRYADIRRAIEDRIISGELQPGDRIPGEEDLAAEHGVSRMTANKALSSLADAGLVVRRRRSGSFVASPASQETILEIHDIKSEIVNAGHRYHHVVLARQARVATAAERTQLSLPARGRVLSLSVQHFADDRPFVLEDRLISIAAVPEAMTVDFSAVPPGTWLLDRIPWTDARHTIRAINAPARVAGRLELRVGTACLVIDRVTWRSGAPVTSVRLTYPGDRHVLSARFSAGGRGRKG
ncbi:MAG TPA: histidine utilization repressor [Gemmatimonadaceae bacterium]